MIELVGFIGAGFVIMSLCQKEKKMLHMLNGVGCILLLLNALFIHSMSFAVLNSIMMIQNGFMIFKEIKNGKIK